MTAKNMIITSCANPPLCLSLKFDTFTTVNYSSWSNLCFHWHGHNQFENSRAVYFLPRLIWAPHWNGKTNLRKTTWKWGDFFGKRSTFLGLNLLFWIFWGLILVFLTRRWTGGNSDLSWADERHQGTPVFNILKTGQSYIFFKCMRNRIKSAPLHLP